MSNLVLRKRKDITEKENDIPIFLTNLSKKMIFQFSLLVFYHIYVTSVFLQL